MGLGEILKGLYALDLTAGILIQEVKADKVGIGGNTAAAKAIPTGSGYDPTNRSTVRSTVGKWRRIDSAGDQVIGAAFNNIGLEIRVTNLQTIIYLPQQQ